MFYQKDATLEEMQDAFDTFGFPYICDGDNKLVWIDFARGGEDEQ